MRGAYSITNFSNLHTARPGIALNKSKNIKLKIRNPISTPLTAWHERSNSREVQN